MTARVRFRWRNSRPEQRWLSRDVSLFMDGDLDVPFRVLGGQEALVHPSSLAEPAATAVLIRHALELALWTRLGGSLRSRADQLAIGILVGRVAALYWRDLPETERRICLAALPDWLAAAYAMLAAEDAISPRNATEALVVGQQLLRLHGKPAGKAVRGAASEQRVIRRLGELWEIAAPAEHLLARGNDDLLAPDPASGLNQYGCSPRPRPDALAFASSTASSISQQAYDEVEALRQSLIEQGLRGKLAASLSAELDRVRQRLLETLGLRRVDGLEVILVSSGPDAEHAALHLARIKASNRLLNLLVGPEEAGNGVAHAAQGLHFGSLTPHGDPVTPGTPVAGLGSDRGVTLAAVPVRDASGAPRRVAQIDAEVADQVRRAATAGQRCLIHLLDGSSTGLRAPSLAAVQALRARFDDAVDVVVDASQLRLGPEQLRGYLESGFMVVITGSKFAMGPPSSGALLVPGPIAARIGEVAPLPAGRGQYGTRAAWPKAWARITDRLPERPDLGLLLRWHAALWEIGAFHAVPAEQRRTILTALGDAARTAIGHSSFLELLPSLSADGDPGGSDDLAAIFAFRLVRPAVGNRALPLDLEATSAVHRWLNQDLSGVLPTHVPETARRVAAVPCQLGQPVRIGAGGGALTLCFGAHTVSEVAFDPHLGQTWRQRLDLQVERTLSAIKKAELIAKYYDLIRLRLEPRPARAASAAG